MSERILLVLGGVRVGDIFHAVPFFNWVQEFNRYKITWIYGSYGKEACKLIIEYSHLSSLFENSNMLNDDFPTDLNSVKNFINKTLSNYCLKGVNDFSHTIADPLIIYSSASRISFPIGEFIKDPKYMFLNIEECQKDDYIVIQPYTLSQWKNLDEILNVEYPLPVKSIGLPGELLMPGAEDCRGKPIEEVAKIIKGCRVFVGQHSAMTVLSFYLGVPTVALHFKEGLFEFGSNKSNCIDLIKPNIIEVSNAVNRLLEES